MTETTRSIPNVLSNERVLDASDAQGSSQPLSITLNNLPMKERVFDLGLWDDDDPLQSDVYRWYQSLASNSFPDGKDPTKIEKLQVWSLNRYSKRLTHRFVLLHMADGKTVHQLDRRATDQANPTLFSGLSSRGPGVRSTDEMRVNVEVNFSRLARESHLEVEIQLDGKIDLRVVLLTCYRISQHKRAKKYDLRDYNCFFYSWTILTIAARCLLDIDSPSLGKDELMNRFRHKEHLPPLAQSIVESAVHTLRDLVLASVGVFREQQQADNDNGRNIRQGMHLLARAVWALPGGFLEILGKVVLKSKLPPNLRETLLKKIEEVLAQKAHDVYKQVLDFVDIRLSTQDQLWVDEGVEQIVRREVEKTLIEQLWPAVVGAITIGFGKDVQSAEDIAPKVVARKKRWWRLAGTRTAQLVSVQTASLHGGLKQVEITARVEVERIKAQAQSKSPDNTSEQLRLLNADMFDLAWNSARLGALDFAKGAVEATNSTLRPRHVESRKLMWGTIWGVWNECWEEACNRARPKALDALDTIVQDVLAASVKVVLDEIRVGESQPTIHVLRPKRVFDIELSSSIWKEDSEMTGPALQQYMQELMKKAKLGSPDDLQDTMAEIWRELAVANFDFAKIGQRVLVPVSETPTVVNSVSDQTC